MGVSQRGRIRGSIPQRFMLKHCFFYYTYFPSGYKKTWQMKFNMEICKVMPFDRKFAENMPHNPKVLGCRCPM